MAGHAHCSDTVNAAHNPFVCIRHKARSERWTCHSQVGVACGAAAIFFLAVGLACLVVPALTAGSSHHSNSARFSAGSTAATTTVQRAVSYGGNQLQVSRPPEPLPPGTDTGTYRAGRPFPPPISGDNEHMPALGIPVEKVWGQLSVPGEPVTPR